MGNAPWCSPRSTPIIILTNNKGLHDLDQSAQGWSESLVHSPTSNFGVLPVGDQSYGT